MRVILTFFLVLFSVVGLCLAQQLAVAARCITPDEVVQESIQQERFTTNQFVVRWAYTEAGAKKFLEFNEAHRGEDVRLIIGKFETPLHLAPFQPMPPVFTNYAQWKEGWLKRRTDKIFCSSEKDAQAIVAGLKSK